MKDSNLGELVKTHRKLAGLSQLELANLSGVGKTTIFDIEKNKESVHWQNIKAVLKVLNIQINFISPIKQS